MAIDKNFFLNLEYESDVEEDAEIEPVFSKNVYALSRDNVDHIARLREEMERIDKLKK
ncbi:hypothetical protein NUSPORA_01294 [Nucleospora cyclopteri]